MELSKDKRETGIVVSFRILYISLACLILPLFKYVSLKQVILISLLLLLSIVFDSVSKFAKRYSVYIYILIFFLPVSISMNYSQISVIHILILCILVLQILVVLIFKGDMAVLSRQIEIFAVSLFLLMNVLLLFVYYAPIRAEYQTHIDLLQVLLKSNYLLLLLYLLYFDLKLVDVYRHIEPSGILKFLSFRPIVVLFGLLFVVLTLFDIISVKNAAERCIKNKSDPICRREILKISGNMRVKGLHRQNLEFLGAYIEKMIAERDKSVLDLISSAERMYPYECAFARQRIQYYRTMNEMDNLNRYLTDLPAPIRKDCDLKAEAMNDR